MTYSDIENHSSYNASGFGLSGGVTVSGGETAKEVGGVAGVGSQGNFQQKM